MKLENEFVVPAPIDRAWTVMLDVERITPCLPGASLDESIGDEHKGTMKVKLGPITSTYKGTLKIQEADEESHRAVLVARARDARGQGNASATITSTLEPDGEGTRVRVETDMRITGPAAQFGRGVMQDVSAKLMNEFAACLAEEIRRGEAVAPATAGAGATAGAPPAAPTGVAAGTTVAGETTADEALAGTSPGAEHASAPAHKTAGVTTAASDAAAHDTVPPSHQSPRRAAEVLDLGSASREAVLKRAVPVAAALAILALLLWIVRGRS
jgi:carbon monoxide dehydrogenase subunit G